MSALVISIWRSLPTLKVLIEGGLKRQDRHGSIGYSRSLWRIPDIASGIALPTAIAKQFPEAPRRSAYFYAALFVIEQTSSLSHDTVRFGFQELAPTTAYFFEYIQKGHGHLKAVMDAIISDPKVRDHWHIASFTHADKRMFFPLQAADILAYELYHDWPKIGSSPRGMRYPLRKLASQFHIWRYVFNRITDFDGKAILGHNEWDTRNING